MHNYRVVDTHSGHRWMLLEGGVGCFHWVRVLSDVPRVGDILTGSRPHLGFGLLRSQHTGSNVRVHFETIYDADCGFNLAWLPQTPSVAQARP